MTAPTPTFFVIGAMKAGTQSLYRYLKAHDQIALAPKDAAPLTTPATLSDIRAAYESLFPDRAGVVARGDVATRYSQAPSIGGVPERMARAVPDARVVYLVRNPLDRILSMHHSLVLNGRESRRLEQAVVDDPSYLDISRYGMQLDHYLEHFARSQILVVQSEDLREHRAAALAGIFEFVGVSPQEIDHTIEREWNRAVDKRALSPALLRLRNVASRLGLDRVLPNTVRKGIRRRIGRRVRRELPSAELEAWIWDELDPDLRRLREIVGPGPELWGRA